MGNCQSTDAVSNDVVVDTARLAKKGKQAKEESNSSSTHMISDRDQAELAATESADSKENATPDVSKWTATAKEGWKDKPGYSSGASSRGLGDRTTSSQDEGSDSERAMDPLRLTSMRNVFLANGDLTQAVVRLETPFGKPIEEIYEGVHDGPFLGEGVSGVVRLVKHRATGVQYACKVLDIGLIYNQTETAVRQLRDEISIMCQLDHPNIVRIEEVYESTNTIYLLQELCWGGDLFDRLDKQPDVHYTEAQCAKLIKQMLSAVRYLHSKGVIHRDLKLENFLFSSSGADSELKMIDFGLSKHFDLGEVHHEQVGTPYTCAPEILRGSYDEKCDIWSVGVITYLLLSGETPFGGCYENECMNDVRQNILSGSFKFEPEDIWENVSDLSKKFVTMLLNVDPEKRPTAKDVQRDEWLRVYAGKADSSCEGNKLSPRIVDALVNFKEYSEMRRLLHEVLSFTLLPEQIVGLRDEFKKIDSEGDGQITLAAMKEVLMNSAGAGALGGLTEEEVEDIFNALRVNKNDSTIRWHEFIAAGLSQCKVDDRNLQLAFDRLDADRKGYICFDDLTYLLGHAPETLDRVKNMWKESMYQCSCKSERISYEDFLVLMKGQTRRESQRPSMVWSPQAAALLSSDLSDDEMAETKLGSPYTIPQSIPEEDESSQTPEGGIGRGRYFRKRSKSFDDLSLGSDESSLDGTQVRRASLQQRVRPSLDTDGDLVLLIANEAKAPLMATREQYLEHRDLRIALCEASKAFDIKSQALRSTRADKVLGSPVHGANLIMKRGSLAPPDLESAHQRALFDAAVTRGGRHAHTKHAKKAGHRRKRTQSDVTGLILQPSAAAS